MVSEAAADGEDGFRIHRLGESGSEFTKRYLFTVPWAKARKISVRPREQAVQPTRTLLACSLVPAAK